MITVVKKVLKFQYFNFVTNCNYFVTLFIFFAKTCLQNPKSILELIKSYKKVTKPQNVNFTIEYS
jgi:hypothetical protein